MFWLYFARDLYQAPQTAPASRGYAVLHSLPAAVAYASALQPRIAALAAAKHAPQAAARNTTPDIEIPNVPAGAYAQRLSVDGDHAFAIWDEEAGFSMFSANFERITGLYCGDCAGHDWIHAIHADQQYAINEALLNAKNGQNGRCLLQARSSESLPWRWLMADIKAPTARQPVTMVLWRDLSEQKALEETLQHLETSLAMSERGRSAFLSSMSHELRTPLNAIMGFSEMMTSGVFGELENPTYQQYAKHIHESGSTLLGKVNDLLDIASMDVGGLALEESEFMLPELLLEVIEMHSHHAFAREQKLKLDCPHALEFGADRAKLLCAVSHLIGNALRHSADGAEVTISVRVQADDGVIISVRDAGEGISAAQLDIIRAALNAEVAYFNIECGGIGLGLSLAKELTVRHGGRIMIDSVRHRGTVVSIIIPTSRVVRGLPVKKQRRS